MTSKRTSRSPTVGYGKPPVGSRFNPGRSGNPKGRPKRLASLAAALRQELRSKLTVTIEGKRQTVPAMQAMIMRLASESAKGSTAATELLLKAQQLGAKTEATKTAGRGSPRPSAIALVHLLTEAATAYYIVKVYQELYGSLPPYFDDDDFPSIVLTNDQVELERIRQQLGLPALPSEEPW